MSAKRSHAVKFADSITSHEPVRVTWHVVDCSCGWQSPLCAERAKADKLYEAHKRRKRAG